MQRRKLIEVALPLEAINRAAVRENEPFTRNHPRSLHIWWARRPLAVARAVLFAQLVDDPSSRPEEFPTEAAQRAERDRLHALIERLVRWENVRDEKLFAEARAEIMRSCDGNPPAILDPFAGGGSIPLEAQRLGLATRASDLNPVAVLINKALIEIPPKFRGQRPVFPSLGDSTPDGLIDPPWQGVRGLAADIRAYGAWVSDEAERRLAPLFPCAELPDGSVLPVSAWIWARTITCPNPACGIQMPLVRSWWLCKKPGKETYIVPCIIDDPMESSGKKARFEISHNQENAPSEDDDGTVGRSGAICIACRSRIELKEIRSLAQRSGMGRTLMAIVAEGNRTRVYLAPSDAHLSAADVVEPDTIPLSQIPKQAPSFRVQAYGFRRWSDMFTGRQLRVLEALGSLVSEVRLRVVSDGGSIEYADALATYLALSFSRYTDMYNSLCSWNQTNENIRALFTLHGIPMVWDYVEANPFGRLGILGPIASVANSIHDAIGPMGDVCQGNASDLLAGDALLCTDPPYYDNVGYSDLSDFFYVWLRSWLSNIHPDIFGTVLVPKNEELVANQYRHGGKVEARRFFEEGFRRVFEQVRLNAMQDFPIVVYYAFKQGGTSVADERLSGWETFLEGMIRSGWEITSTWPVRSERQHRKVGLGTNALASSIVLSLRPRPAGAPSTDRRGFIAALEAELPAALRKLQQGQIAPVDLPQAAIGPGMAVFSRYAGVLEPDGHKMTVRSALARINEILDQVLNEQEGDFDSTTRFAVAWYRQHGYDKGTFGEADNLARARNTSVETMDRDEILTSRAGVVQLIRPADLPEDYDPLRDSHTSNWEALHHLIARLDAGGVTAAGAFLREALSRLDAAVDADLVKELAHLLFRIAEASGRTKDALAFNNIVTSWPEVREESRRPTRGTSQGLLNFDEEV